MDVDPMAVVDADGDTPAAAARSRLNTRVAITVALLATFTGVCKVKDDNIVQGMQQAQADRVDHWSYYQAKNIRADVARATADQLRTQAAVTGGERSAPLIAAAARWDSVARNEETKRDQVRKLAEDDAHQYDALNYRDDQFDLADALAAIAISLLAMTSLTQKRWLWWIALAFTAGAVIMGTAGLAGWKLHSDTLAAWLS